MFECRQIQSSQKSRIEVNNTAIPADGKENSRESFLFPQYSGTNATAAGTRWVASILPHIDTWVQLPEWPAFPQYAVSVITDLHWVDLTGDYQRPYHLPHLKTYWCRGSRLLYLKLAMSVNRKPSCEAWQILCH